MPETKAEEGKGQVPHSGAEVKAVAETGTEIKTGRGERK